MHSYKNVDLHYCICMLQAPSNKFEEDWSSVSARYKGGSFFQAFLQYFYWVTVANHYFINNLLKDV